MQAKKSLGQNFLMHARTAERIADAAGITPDDTVLEIGPGTGKLTRALLARAAHVIAVEADAVLVRELKETFARETAEGKLEIIESDIRTFNEELIPGGYKLVANIPYYITGEIIRTFLESAHKPRSMTLLVQKEVAERVARQDAKKPKESILSIAVKAYGTPKYKFTVPRGAFMPAPNVDSAVLSVEGIRQDAFGSPDEERRFFDVLHAGFAHKRKLLVRNLEDVAAPERIRDAFSAVGIGEKARAEDVGVESWRALARALA
jgi:16S rRNA (adenine1518-N6/adenine1519-N6)-dimethyltransferase